jgi:hypothetical protein
MNPGTKLRYPPDKRRATRPNASGTMAHVGTQCGTGVQTMPKRSTPQLPKLIPRKFVLNPTLQLAVIGSIAVLTVLCVARILVSPPEVYSGGMCCALDSNVKGGIPEPLREQIDSTFLEGIGQFYFGVGELEKVDVNQFARTGTEPALRLKMQRAAQRFNAARASLSMVLRLAEEARIPQQQTSDVRQILSAIDRIAESTNAGSFPDPGGVHDAMQLMSRDLSQCTARALLHRGMPGHLKPDR